jgi:hypothetical protein
MGGAGVSEQMSRAHRYQNTLIEIERRRRDAIAAVQRSHDTTVPLVAQEAALVHELDAQRASLSAAASAKRSRRAVNPEQRARAVEIKAQLREVRAALKAARQALRDDPEVGAQIARANEQAKAESKAARAACGVYWGTYLLTEQAMDAARRHPTPPHFRRWMGDGAVGVQIQHGIGVAELLDGRDQRMQIDLTTQPVSGRQGKPRPRVRLRIGSTDRRDPIWAEWPLIYHRPLPEGGRIKTAKVVRRRVCGKDDWSLHITVQTPAVVAEPIGPPAIVAVDLGWRRAPDNLRAGGWCDGTTERDIMLEASVPGELRKAADIRAIRDTHQNEIQAQLIAWRESIGTLPAEHAEALRYVAQWKSPSRFVRLAQWWREHRIAGDDVIVEAQAAWRKRDRHLWLWETHARQGAIGRRRDQYRRFAADLASRYDVLVIERLALDKTIAIPAPESVRENVPAGRRQQVQVAPSELRAALVNAFRARGRQVVTVPAGGPSSALLATYRERSGDVQIMGGAREARFVRVARLIAEREAAKGSGHGHNWVGARTMAAK